jgi:hydrogenase-4 component E
VTGTLTWVLVLAALAVVVVRRRSVATCLVAVQSVLLGAHAIAGAGGRSSALLVAGAVVLAKAVILPGALFALVRRTREPQWIASERHPFVRLAIAAAIALPIAALVPRFALLSVGVQRGAVALIALGVATAVVRRPTVFQALGFLIAENGLYLAALSVRGGLPAVIDLGVVFDLIVSVSVAAVFTAKIHEQLGTADTTLLGGLRD